MVDSIQDLAKSFDKKSLSKNNGHELQDNIPDVVKQIVDAAIGGLKAIFPAWRQAVKSQKEADRLKVEYVKAFYENKINTPEQVKLGLKRARSEDRDFIPSPGKFCSWCKISPESQGWPDAEDCLDLCIACHNNQKLFKPLPLKSRPVVLELVKKLDWWIISNKDEKAALGHLKKVYDKLLKSGYQEPDIEDLAQLTTSEAVNQGMSDEQKEDARKRGREAMAKIKQKIGKKS